MSKLRNRANLVITIGVAPVLALLIASILRYSDSGHYDFASAYHIPTFLFLALIVAMFLGLTNSADDIIRDRAVLQRERNLDVRLLVLHFLENALARHFCARAMHPVRLARQLRAANSRNVLDRSRDYFHDGDERCGAGVGRFVARRRSQNGRQHCSARAYSADHHGWRAH